MKKMLSVVAVAAMSLPFAALTQQIIPVSPGQPTTCSGFNTQMCMEFCRKNRNDAAACHVDCNGRLSICLGQGDTGLGKTHAGHYLWGSKWVGPLIKE